MGRAIALVLVACLASCYQSPSLASCKYRCGGANNNSCPSGFECNAGMCVAPGDQCDGDGGVIDAPDVSDSLIDMSTIDATMCPNPDVNMWVPQPTLSTGTSLKQIVVLDGNNDNKVDLVALDEIDEIGFFAGKGNGTFDARQETIVSPVAALLSKRVVTGDFDRDGQRDDLLVLQTGDNELAIMASLGNGLFSRTSVLLGANVADFGSAGDVDGNGREDVIVMYSGATSRLEVLLQTDVSPFWGAGTMVATNQNATSVFVGKVNGNNITDAIVTMTGTGQMGLHVGSGTSPFGLSGLTVANVPSPVQAVAGQLRPSGTPSIVTVSTSASNVTTKHINGVSGTTDGDTIAVGTSPKAVILANVVGSALPEIITADSGSNQFTVLLNEDGNFADAVLTPTGTTPSDLVAADFDADGRLDLAVANVGSQTISIFLNKCQP